MTVEEYQDIRYDIITGLEKIIDSADEIFLNGQHGKILIEYILIQLKSLLDVKNK